MKDRISLTLNGEIPVNLFAEAITGLSDLLNALTKEIASDKTIEWQIVELNTGSATAVIQGIAETTEEIEKITDAYSVIGHRIQHGLPIPYSDEVTRAARNITKILNGKISSIEFSTDSQTHHITETYQKDQPGTKAYTYGAISGKVENLFGHKTLKFTLYDNLFNKAVTCYMEEEKRELLRDIWGKNVTVTGCILREITTGRPLEISEIQSIEIQPQPEPGAHKKARGILPWKPGDETAEQTIRRIRDDEQTT